METLFARSARRNTIDLFTVTEIVGATCCWAPPISGDSTNGIIATQKKLSLIIILRRPMIPPAIRIPLEFDDFTIVALDHFNLILIWRYRPARCGSSSGSHRDGQ